ncbi:MAG: nucleotide exchange factor GrpE [Pelagibacteraceae bacterium]
MDNKNTQNNDLEKEDKESAAEEKNIVTEKEIKEVSLEEKLKETDEKLLRSLAELENQRRRFEKELKDAFEFGGFNFAKESLALLDNLQRAKLSVKGDEKLKDSKDLDTFLNNFEILEKDLISIFEKNKIKKIDCLKEKFDPNIHQAMLEIEDDKAEPGLIIQEIQPGYMFGDRLLRPSFVGVSKKKSEQKSEKNEKKED